MSSRKPVSPLGGVTPWCWDMNMSPIAAHAHCRCMSQLHTRCIHDAPHKLEAWPYPGPGSTCLMARPLTVFPFACPYGSAIRVAVMPAKAMA